MTPEELDSHLATLKRQVWAVVYAYDPPAKPRSLWYDRWRYDVINDYVEAVSFLGAEPLIIDIDSFIRSERLRSEEISLVINLNSGATPISNGGLVPSVAEWNKVPCFPNAGDVIVCGERKDICKQFFSSWFHTPSDINLNDARSKLVPFIVKPKTMGNSQNVTRNLQLPLSIKEQRRWLRDTLIEEFIEGYEVTVPVILDAIADDYVVCPPIIYVPEVINPTDWFLSYEEKMDRKVVIDRRVGRLDPSATKALLDASRSYNSGGLARFDFRWRVKEIKSDLIELQDLWFLEINCMPTLRTDVNFLKSLKSYLFNCSDPVAKFVMDAQSPDIGALSYLLFQFFLATAKTK